MPENVTDIDLTAIEVNRRHQSIFGPVDIEYNPAVDRIC